MIMKTLFALNEMTYAFSMKIDIHAHQVSTNTQVLVGVHTLGIHPWELLSPFDRRSFNQKWAELITRKDGIYAIGECGLDRVRANIANIEDQKYVLMKHFEEAVNRKIPLILHSVRTYSDVLAIFKKIQFPYPVLLHAFGGNHYEMQELLKYPVFFSYGARIFNTDKMLKSTPLERLFLETGDQCDYSIDDIYQKASEALGIDLESLETILKNNFLTFFDKLDNVSSTNFIHDLNTRKSN